MKNKTINWGIIGLGNIAHKFAHDLQLVEGANVYGVASRSIDKAKKFGEQYQADRYYGSYKELTDDPNIDVVYIATPHVYHCELTLMALDAGKAVLCEKAFGMNTAEVEKMIAKAKEKKLFLMEALWTRFIPATEKMLALVNSGSIGELQTVRADFGFKADFDPDKRLFNKELGGGSLLDIGIYPIFLSLLTLGVPKEITARATMSTTAIDSSCMMLFKYANDQTAILDSNINIATPVEGWLHGAKGSLKMHNPFHHTKEISFYKDHNLIENFTLDYIGNGYYHEILEVMQCLRKGKTESEKMPLSFSLELIELLDNVRNEIGLTYN
jgi:predicted dehydrogenase